MSSSVKDLLKKGARDGYVTVADINALVAESGVEPDSLYSMLDEKDIEIRDGAAADAAGALSEPEPVELE